MSTRAQDLADRLLAASEEVIATVQNCSDEQWGATAKSDGRSVCVLAHHIATAHPFVAEWVVSVANGQPMSVDMDAIHAANQQHAEQHASAGRQETIELLRSNAERAAELLRGISDENLDRTAPMAWLGGKEVSAAELAEMVVIGHVQGHLKDIRSAIGG
jgi:uncharacterized damage-inducible protein DinB